ncbi:MAG: DUF2213 domain-containing protein [Deltaproteobacteria bacterium]|nr:DUF2213 domain-containing protein [Deltaproteobacteria bacterium]
MARQYYTTAQLSENQQETPEGYLLCLNVPIARTGALIYAAEELTDKDGKPIIDAPAGRAVVSRTAAVLFDPQTIASFEGKPVTLMHPDVMLTPENWKDYAVGVIQNVRPGDDGDKLIADLLITDAEAIFAVRQGLREVSLGYDAEYVEDAPGVGHQSAMIGNHCALVPAGRCGPECSIQDKQPIEEMSMSRIAKLKEQIRGMFTALDSAVADLEPEDKKEEDDAKAKDAEDPPPEEKKEEAQAMDFTTIVKDLADKIAVMQAAIEALQAKKEEEKTADACDPEKTQDAAPDAETLARAEILAPGIAATADIIPASLKAAYGTQDGKEIIDRLSAGQAPAFDSAALFIAASELMKDKRRAEMAETRKAPAKDNQTFDQHAHFAARSKEVHKVPMFH